MKHLLYIGLITAATLLNALAADPHDNKSLKGDWILVKGEVGGTPMPEQTVKTITMKLGDGKYHVLVAGEPDFGTYEIDSSATPKGMVTKGTEGIHKGKSIPAIYEVDGKTLRICYDLSGAKRPAEFKSVPGTRLYLATYQRKE